MSACLLACRHGGGPVHSNPYPRFARARDRALRRRAFLLHGLLISPAIGFAALSALVGCQGSIMGEDAPNKPGSAGTAGPQPGGDDPAVVADEVVSRTPMRRLTRRQYANTVSALLNLQGTFKPEFG